MRIGEEVNKMAHQTGSYHKIVKMIPNTGKDKGISINANRIFLKGDTLTYTCLVSADSLMLTDTPPNVRSSRILILLTPFAMRVSVI